jgi:hypothetical protein
MTEIAWHLLQPVDTGSQVMQGFQTGMALVKGVQTRSALGAYLQNPDDPKAFGALAYLDPQTAAEAQRSHLLSVKATQDKQDRDRAVALGQLATTDPVGARQEAMSAGDFDLAKTFGELSEADQKKSADFWGKAGALAFRLKQTPDPQARVALWQQARPILQAEGAPTHLLDQFDPNNETQLDAAITTAQGIDKLIEQSRVTWHQQGEQPSFATDFMGRPVGTKNPYAGGGGSSPAAASAPAGFDAAVEHVLGNEGGYNPSDMNGKPVNFGINQGANPDLNVKDLTRDQAKQIYHDRYWVPSGAESLPANLQAPYFDVYIRNPAKAKEALAQSGGDPQKFMELASGYFQQLGSTPEGQKYARSWANRDARNLQIATGGNVAAADGTPHIRSKAELDGLPSGTVFIAPDGSRRRKP